MKISKVGYDFVGCVESKMPKSFFVALVCTDGDIMWAGVGENPSDAKNDLERDLDKEGYNDGSADWINAIMLKVEL